MAITTPDGAHNSASLTPGKAYFREAGAQHVARNEGDDVLDFVEVEIVGPRTEATEKDK